MVRLQGLPIVEAMREKERARWTDRVEAQVTIKNVGTATSKNAPKTREKRLQRDKLAHDAQLRAEFTR